jgi:hypothetical protein
LVGNADPVIGNLDPIAAADKRGSVCYGRW